MRNTSFASGEYYHIYNRGVDKRITYLAEHDVQRFYDSLGEFNGLDPIGSIYENSFTKKLGKKLGSSTSKSTTSKPDGTLVSIIAHCVNPNHFHLLLRQEAENGIEKLMHRTGTGYTKYFNNKYKRSGALFQGRYKSIHIDSNEYLLHLSAYINLNDRVHRLGSSASKSVRSRSSWGEYMGDESKGICEKEIILDQFVSTKDYEEFALSSLESIIERKEVLKDMEELLLE